MSVGAQGGTTSITNQTDSIIGASGKPVRVYYVEAISDGTATSVLLRNGTSTSGAILSQIDGVISKSASRYYGANGLLFPAGCFADLDAHTAEFTIAWSQDIT